PGACGSRSDRNQAASDFGDPGDGDVLGAAPRRMHHARDAVGAAAALGLVLAAAILHAAWNLLAKRAGGGAALVWLYGTASAVLLTPFAAPVLIRRPDL